MNLPPLPKLTKRGVAVLSIATTASVFLTLGALFKPVPVAAPTPSPQVIVIVVPATVLPPAPVAPVAPQAHKPQGEIRL